MMIFILSSHNQFVNAQLRDKLPEYLIDKIKDVVIDTDKGDVTYSFKDNFSDTISECILKKDNKGMNLYDVKVLKGNKSQYSVRLDFNVNSAITKGDILLVRLSMRTISARQESGESVVYAIFQEKEVPHTKSLMPLQIGTGNDWKTFDIPFVAHKDFKKNESVLQFALGALEQHVEICGVQVLNFKKSVSLQELPVTSFTYVGREKNAEWRKKALKRIEEIRTAPLSVKVVNSDGSPVKGAEVEVKMLLSDFLWGTAINESALAGEGHDSDQYREHLKELFNTGTIENGLKAAGWSWNEDRKINTIRSFEWLDKNGFRQRGHNLVWPGWKFNTSITKEIALLNDKLMFDRYIKSQLYERMAYTKGRVIAWDVVNEPMHEKDFYKYLPKDVTVEWFKLAHKLDPNAELFINDYAMLNCVQSAYNIKEYVDTIQSLIKKGAPIHGIGVQGHVGRQPRNPEQVLTDLDLFIPTNLPVQITEFDINTKDEELQADYTRDFLIAVYSHPVVNGVILWGFWEPRHWKRDAAMFRKDWSPKPNAAVWRELITGAWKTHETGMTDKKGVVTIRGHFGTYKVYVKYKNMYKEVDCHLQKGGKELLIEL